MIQSTNYTGYLIASGILGGLIPAAECTKNDLRVDVGTVDVGLKGGFTIDSSTVNNSLVKLIQSKIGGLYDM